MDGVSNGTGGWRLPPGTPVLRGSDLLKEAEGMEAKTVDLGNGVIVEQRGGFRRMVGDAQMTVQAAVTAWEAAKIGGDAGRAMFETYRKTHPEEFGAAAVEREKMMMAGEMPPPSPPSSQPSRLAVTVEKGQKYEADPDQAVSVYGNRNVQVAGSARSDFLSVLHGSTVYGLAGNDEIIGGNDVTLDGGDGDDVITARASSRLYGGAGNDRLIAGEGAQIDGGDGDDRVEASHGADITDLSGDNDIHAGDGTLVGTGGGHDRISIGDRSAVNSGDGHDQVYAGARAQVDTGAGDDMVLVGRDSTVTTGTGNDILTVDGGATITFNRGDGHDIIGGGQWGAAYEETDHLSSSTLSFGAGITAADLTLQRQGNDLLVQVGNDSVTLKDVQRHGIPTMRFADGSVLDGAHLEAMAGPAEPYRPLSQVMQNFVDANRAYRNQIQTTGTAV